MKRNDKLDFLVEKLKAYENNKHHFSKNTLLSLAMPELDKIIEVINMPTIKPNKLINRPEFKIHGHLGTREYREEMKDYINSIASYPFESTSILRTPIVEAMANYFEEKQRQNKYLK